MYQTVNEYHFRNAFHAMGRGDQFTHDALNMLFSYLEEAAPDAELDVVAICCEYAEDMPASIAEDYGLDLTECSDGICTASAYGLEQVAKAELNQVLEYLNEKTQVIGVTDAGAIVYCSEF
jgi:hypothetical protein